MPIQMAPRFNFEAIDIHRLKKNLRVKAASRRKRQQTPSYDSDGEEIQHIDELHHNPPSPEVLPAFSSRKSSPTIRTFNPQNLLPVNNGEPPSSRVASPAPRIASPLPLDFNPNAPLPPLPGHRPLEVDLTRRPATSSQIEDMKAKPVSTFEYSSGEEKTNFDLRPPPPNRHSNTLDGLSELLFSEGHLRAILQDPILFARFTVFLNRYKPHTAPILIRYLDTQKAIKAVEYANAVAETISSLPGDPPSLIPCAAALVDVGFKERCEKAFEILLADALPAYITNCLVKIVSESMIKEVTGAQAPVMRDLLGGLAEVFCLTDPSIKDNPIVYASEEFYRTTQYGRDYVIGRNCRFLQGPKTDPKCVDRLRKALQNGQEISEVILNYRRDGTPFFNLLMMAPLHDNKGAVRYFIGAQVDISGLIEEGRGLESLEKYIMNRRVRKQQELDEWQAGKRLTRVSDGSDQFDSTNHQSSGKPKTLKKLKELSEMFSHEECAVVSNHSRSNSLARDDAASINSQQRRRPHTSHNSRPARRVLIDGSRSDDEDEEHNPWAISSFGPSGKLPGVYQNYLLVRPYPSLRIIFVSPALRIPGLLQSPFLSHVGAPLSVRDGLADAFSSGIAVTARISWLSNPSNKSRQSTVRDSLNHSQNRPHSPNGHLDDTTERGQTRWISCTPLLGSDDRVGVWMIVMVEKALSPTRAGASSRQTIDRERAFAPSPNPGHPRVVDATAMAVTVNNNRATTSTIASDDLYLNMHYGNGNSNVNGNGNFTALPLAGKGSLVNGGNGKPYTEFLKESQVGRASDGHGRNRRDSDVNGNGHQSQASESITESLGEELMGRLHTL